MPHRMRLQGTRLGRTSATAPALHLVAPGAAPPHPTAARLTPGQTWTGRPRTGLVTALWRRSHSRSRRPNAARMSRHMQGRGRPSPRSARSQGSIVRRQRTVHRVGQHLTSNPRTVSWVLGVLHAQLGMADCAGAWPPCWRRPLAVASCPWGSAPACPRVTPPGNATTD